MICQFPFSSQSDSNLILNRSTILTFVTQTLFSDNQYFGIIRLNGLSLYIFIYLNLKDGIWK